VLTTLATVVTKNSCPMSISPTATLWPGLVGALRPVARLWQVQWPFGGGGHECMLGWLPVYRAALPGKGDVAVQNSERSLVPLPSELAGLPPVPDGRIDVPRLLTAAALGLAVEAQRRSLDAAAAIVGRLGWPLRVLSGPAVAVA
jgi:hypothetical protein